MTVKAALLAAAVFVVAGCAAAPAPTQEETIAAAVADQQKSTEQAYLQNLRQFAPDMWNVAGASDVELVKAGRLGCALAAKNNGQWTQHIQILTDNGVAANDAGVLAFSAVRYLCPDQMR